MKNWTVGLLVCCAMLFAAPALNAADNAYGGLYVTGGSTAQTLSTTAAKVTAFTTVLTSSSSDGDLSVVASAANDNVAVVAGGVYAITWTSCGTADATTKITYSLRDGATAITGATTATNHVASTSMGTNITMLYKPTADGAISVYAVAASATPAITITDSQLVVVRIK